MTPARIRRAAQVLREEAERLHSKLHMRGDRWFDADAKARHDEMLALAEEFEAHATGIELAEALIEAIQDD